MNNVEKYVISKEDFKKYFRSKRIISREDYFKYLNKKNDNTFDNTFYGKWYKMRKYRQEK